MPKYTRFRDIPQLTKAAAYRVNVPWDHLERWLASHEDANATSLGCGLDLNPDFQRGHVWTPEQQIAYVEFRLRGGESGREIMWNHPGWMKNWKGDLQIVDGLQRLTAARRFMANELPAFGSPLREYEDPMRVFSHDFIMYINDLPTRAAVLRWYLEINASGTPHSHDEIARVQALLDAETTREAA